MQIDFIDQPNLMLDYVKEVKTIYPYANCFAFNESYCIMEIPHDVERILNQNKVFQEWPVCYSRWQDSPELAWRAAWERIIFDMLKKLEQ